MRIFRVRTVTAELTEAVARLMPQLSNRIRIPAREELQRIVESPTTALLWAESAKGLPMGMLTLAWYEVPSGRCAWIEDVVVDETQRGQGVGEGLVCAALALAAEQGVQKVSLTSAAARLSAHGLYHKMGFVEYETNVFRKKL